VAAVGDMACAPGSSVTSTKCRQLAVSNLVVNDPDNEMLLALGDLQYENGDLAGFQSTYDSSYGRIKAKTMPTVGNHEYGTAGASGYFTYFGAAAGTPSKGYYSFDVGSTWHVVTLNSNCDIVSCATGSAQEQWLRADLAATSRPCVIATWHHPRFSSSYSNTPVGPLWTALQQYGAELVLNGHEHSYERFKPQLANATASATGIQEIVVGTGGRSLDGFNTPLPNSVVRLSTFGVLKLALGDNTYSWQFVKENGTVADSGTLSCH
jgi:Calcineurin-like phosphoesterase